MTLIRRRWLYFLGFGRFRFQVITLLSGVRELIEIFRDYLTSSHLSLQQLDDTSPFAPRIKYIHDKFTIDKILKCNIIYNKSA